MEKMTLHEFFYREFDSDFDNQEDATNFLNSIAQFPDKIKHYGDCTNENISCHLCMLTDLLNAYYKYIKNEKID